MSVASVNNLLTDRLLSFWNDIVQIVKIYSAAKPATSCSYYAAEICRG